MKLAELVDKQSIIADLDATDRNGAIRDLVAKLAEAGHVDADQVDKVAKRIITRERERGTTGFGKGVAVPHAKLEEQSRVVAAVGRSQRGIDFASLDGEPVFGIFLILSPTDQPEAHLQAMDLIFRHLQQEKFRSFLRQSDTVEKIYDLLAEADDMQEVG
jgi:mannitol/fructose-specific phosphotransferase system IIA component (Ntr-type)